MTDFRPDIVLIDAPNLVYRAWWPHRAATTPAGVPCGLEVGFLRSFLALARAVAPAPVALCWDGKSARCRALEPDYKASRPDPPEPDWVVRVAALRDALAALVPSYYAPDLEADEQVAALVARHVAAGKAVLVASNDGDFLQLVGPQVRVLAGDRSLRDADYVLREWGVPPAHLALLRAVAGDRSDGLPGVGRVRADRRVALAAESAGVESLLANAALDPTLSPGERAKFRAGADRVRKNFALMDLRDPAWEAVAYGGVAGPPDLGPVGALCTRLGLHDLRAAGEWRLFAAP